MTHRTLTLAALLAACTTRSVPPDTSPVHPTTPIQPVPPTTSPVPPTTSPVPPTTPIQPVPPTTPTGSPVPPTTSPVPPTTSPVPPTTSPVPPTTPAPPSPRPPPPGFVDLRATLPTACFTPGYAAADNFTGAPLPGYAAPGAWLLAKPAAALARVQTALAADHLTLLIFDAYRPRRASEAMVAWAEQHGRGDLLRGGYIARKSNHNHGTTVDLGLATTDCRPLDMGTAWDTLDPRSHTTAATGEPLQSRLRRAMRAAGFRDYPREWWHFSFPLAGTTPRDVPYGPQEPPEPG